MKLNTNNTKYKELINEMDKEVIQRAIVGFERLDISHIAENFTNESVLKKAFLTLVLSVV